MQTTLDDATAPSLLQVDVEHLDHLVLTVRDVDATCRFYGDLLGMERVVVGEGRTAVQFGGQRFHLHEVDGDLRPVAAVPLPGSADLCLLVRTPIEGVLRALVASNVEIELGPVERDGAAGRLLSVYVRDPDGNLVELANRLDS